MTKLFAAMAWNAHWLLCASLACAAGSDARPSSSIDIERASQLVQATSLDRALGTDLALLNMQLENFPATMPPELRTRVRAIIEKDLDYSHLRLEIATLVASRLPVAQITEQLRFWTSPSGSRLADAESDGYAAYFGGLTPVRIDHPVPRAPNPQLIESVFAAGGFKDFVHTSRQFIDTTQLCLTRTATLGEDCSAPAPIPAVFMNPIHGDGQIRESFREAVLTQRSYLLVAPADLEAYLHYLESTDARAALNTLRGSMLEVERRRTVHALDEVSSATQKFLRGRAGDSQEALRIIEASIDAGENLEQSRTALQLLRQNDPSDPAIPVELARVALKLGDTNWSEEVSLPPTVGPNALEEAQHWLDSAHALNPRRADTLVLEGHLAYLKHDYARSMKILEQARQIGSPNPWLTFNLAESAWARGVAERDPQTLQRAALEFEASLKNNPECCSVQRVYRALAEIYDSLGNVAAADRNFKRLLPTLDDDDRARAFARYSSFLLYKIHDPDAALAAARAGFESDECDECARATLVRTLWVKSGLLFAEHQPTKALALVHEARKLQPDLSAVLAGLGVQGDFPAYRALHDSGLMNDFSRPEGGKALGLVSRWAGPDEIDQLLAWGADPNYLEPNGYTVLQLAIYGDNLAAVKELIARGASPLGRLRDGRLPSQLKGEPNDTKRAEILAYVETVAKQRSTTLTTQSRSPAQKD